MLDHKKLRALKLKCRDLGMEMQDLREFMIHVRTRKLLFGINDLLAQRQLSCIILRSFEWRRTTKGQSHWQRMEAKYKL